MTLLVVPRPEPWHTGHGSSTTSPRPLHSRHGSDSENPPALVLVWPVPVHAGHTLGTVPARAPVPAQDVHADELVMRSGTVTPSTASANPMLTSLSTSAPRRACVVRAREPNNPPNTSPIPPAPAPVVPVPPNRSPRSKLNVPPDGPPAPLGTRNPLPNSDRASSYSLRLLGLDSTE